MTTPDEQYQLIRAELAARDDADHAFAYHWGQTTDRLLDVHGNDPAFVALLRAQRRAITDYLATVVPPPPPRPPWKPPTMPEVRRILGIDKDEPS